MTGNNERRRPRRVALWSAAPALLAVVVAAKLMSVGALGASAEEAFQSAHHGGVAQAASWLAVANVVEPHKAYFASGDAHVLAGDFGAAREDFEFALQAGAGADECKVRVNLVLSIEKLGDAKSAAGEKPAAAALLQEALETAASSAGRCQQSGQSNAAGEGDRLADAESRLKEKLAADDDASGGSKPAGEAPPAPEQQQLRQLEESAQQAQRERMEGQERGEYLRGPDNEPSVERPW